MGEGVKAGSFLLVCFVHFRKKTVANMPGKQLLDPEFGFLFIVSCQHPILTCTPCKRFQIACVW